MLAKYKIPAKLVRLS